MRTPYAIEEDMDRIWNESGRVCVDLQFFVRTKLSKIVSHKGTCVRVHARTV